MRCSGIVGCVQMLQDQLSSLSLIYPFNKSIKDNNSYIWLRSRATLLVTFLWFWLFNRPKNMRGGEPRLWFFGPRSLLFLRLWLLLLLLLSKVRHMRDN